MNADIDALINRGEPISGMIVPARNSLPEKAGGNARKDRHNGIFYEPERAIVCLNCPLEVCEGSARCYRRAKDKGVYHRITEAQKKPQNPPEHAENINDDITYLNDTLDEWMFILPDLDFDTSEFDKEFRAYMDDLDRILAELTVKLSLPLPLYDEQ